MKGVHCGVFDFVFTGLPPGGEAVARSVGAQSTDDRDEQIFAIYPRPPFTVGQAETISLAVRFGQTRLIEIESLASSAGGEALDLNTECDLTYTIYPAHQLKLSKNRTQVDTIYITIVDVTTDVAARRPTYQIAARPAVPHPRIVPCKWFPPDIEPAVYGIKIDPKTVPQRSPMWWKLRGELTGSKTYSLLGWFMPAERNAPKEVFSKASKANMRLGSVSEALIVENYLKLYPDRIFHEVGWCDAPRPEYPKGWGASPDGWVEVPGAQGAPGTTIAMEFKTSRNKISMEGYFIPQVYMEMISLEVNHCDLIRYCVSRDVAHIYHIKRDPELEDRLIQLWKLALHHPSLYDLVRTPQFVQMRDELNAMAREWKPAVVMRVEAPLDLPAQREDQEEQQPAAVSKVISLLETCIDLLRQIAGEK